MVNRTRIWVWFLPVVLLLTPLAGCSGDDDDRPDGKKAENPSDGELRGVAQARPSKGGGYEFFIRSA